ncbi:hypothetical protein QQ045_023004 [Rhodiola kirilowii]
MLFVISSLEAAWVDEVTDINDLDELNAIGMDENGIGKHKHLCREECDHPAMGRCLKSECIQACKETGYITGKCKKSSSYDVKKCYCYKDCKKDHHPHLPAHPHEGPPIKGRPAKGRSAKGRSADYPPVKGPFADYPPVESPPADSPPEKHRLIKRRRRPSKGHLPTERVPAGGHPPVKGVPSGGVPVIGLPVPVGVLPVPVGVLPIPIGVLPIPIGVLPVPIGGSHAKGSPSTKNPPSKGADIEVPVKGRPCLGTTCRKCGWIRNLISMRKQKSCFRN